MRNPNLLTHHHVQTRIIPIYFGEDDEVVYAGSPVNAKGEFANDATAIGILLDDVYPFHPFGEVIIGGFIDGEIAQNAAGITYTKECMTALKNLTIEGVGSDWTTGSSGGGGEGFSGHWDDIEGKPFGEEISVYTLIDNVEANHVGLDDGFDVDTVRFENSTYTLVDGTKYKLTVNDKEMFGTAEVFSATGRYATVDFVGFGNKSILTKNESDDTGEAYVVAIAQNTSFVRVMGKMSTLEHGVYSIYEERTTFTTIPKEYLPERLQHEVIIEDELAEQLDWKNLKNKPFGEEVKETFVQTFDGNGFLNYSDFLSIWGSYRNATTIVYAGGERYVGSWSGERLNFGSYSIYHEFGNCFTDYPGEFSIYVEETITTPLPSKFIGDDIARVEDIPEIPVHTWESLPDKPFYEEETVIFEKNNYMYDYPFSCGYNEIIVGETYKVTVNGNTFVGTAKVYKDLYVCVGNPGLWVSQANLSEYDNGEAYCLASPGGILKLWVAGLAVYSEGHTVAISKINTKLIPTELLPLHLQFGEKVTEKRIFSANTRSDPYGSGWGDSFSGLANICTGKDTIVYADGVRYIGTWDGVDVLKFGTKRIHHSAGTYGSNYMGPIEIYTGETIITPLDPKYLPPFVSFVIADDKIYGTTFDELNVAFESKTVPIFGMWRNGSQLKPIKFIQSGAYEDDTLDIYVTDEASYTFYANGDVHYNTGT